MPYRFRIVGSLAALVLAGCSIASTKPPGSSAAASADTTATVIPSPVATLKASPTPVASASTAWRPVAEQQSVRAVQLEDVVWTGARFVAVGSARAGGGGVLDSADGLTWHLQSGDVSGPRGERLAVGQGGLVAIGEDADARAVSWHSVDGTAWSDPTATFGKGAGSNTVQVTDVIDNGAGWLAVGREDPACELYCGLKPVRALVWTSDDGLTWKRLAVQTSLIGGAMTGVEHTSSGFVAVGFVGLNAAAWTSPDGRLWARSADAPVLHAAVSGEGDGRTLMASVARGGAVIAAVGTEFPSGGEETQPGRAWWSTDGLSWSEATGDLFGESPLYMVTATATGFVAGGPSGPQVSGCGVWVSTDGRSWSCVSSTPEYLGMTPSAAASSPTVEVVVGYDMGVISDQGFPSQVWWRPVQ